MKNSIKIFSLACICLLAQSAIAQTEDYPVSIGIFGGPVDLISDFDKHTTFDFGGDNTDFHFGAGLDLYANKYFDFGIAIATGSIGHASDKGTLEGDFTGVDLLMKYKFNNGDILKKDAKFAPYLLAGGGITDIYGDSTKIRENLLSNFTWGAGVNIPLSDKLSVDIRNAYRYTSSDNIDYIDEDANDLYMTLTAGLKLNLGKKEDKDGDGISDKNDLCPDTPGLESLMGCPDSDGDGVADKDDACPQAAGTATMNGCPDTDGDGVADNLDECPDAAGTAEMNGCPDKDGDGIADKDDTCPDAAGPAEYMGCPDSDGDQVADNLDKCPDVVGLVSLAGCPDRDNDGVADGDDLCPDAAGLVANKGCPAVSEEVKEIFTQALTGVKFESSRDVIRSSSYSILNNVVQIMKDNPAYKLFIQGHTDSQGDDEMNMDLSRRRAIAVRQYLIDKGIEASRMRTKGFGETVPVADNNTAAGRAKNRRVEFTVEF